MTETRSGGKLFGKPPPTPPYQRQLIARFMWNLVDDPSWIWRHRESIELLDVSRWKRTVTLDIDMDDVAERARRAGLSRRQTLWLPLAFLTKNLTDLEVRDDAGRPLVMAQSEGHSKIALGMLDCVLEDKRLPPLQGSARDSVWKSIRILPDREQTQRLLENQGRGDPLFVWETEDRLGRSPLETLLKDHKDFEALLTQFTFNYMPLVPIGSRPTGVRQISYSYTDWNSSGGWRRTLSWTEKLGYRGGLLSLTLPNVGRAAREYVSFIAPAGTRISAQAVPVVTVAGNRRESPVGSVRTRSSSAIATVYTRDFSRRIGANSGVYASLRIRPDGARFLVPGILAQVAAAIAWFCVAWVFFREAGTDSVLADAAEWVRLHGNDNLAAAVDFVGKALGGDWKAQKFLDLIDEQAKGTSRVDKFYGITSVVPVMTAVLTVFLGFTAREGEHPARTELLRWPRWIVCWSMICCGWSTLVLALHVTNVGVVAASLVGTICVCLAGAASLLLMWFAGRLDQLRMNNLSGYTERAGHLIIR
ncbi:MAG: hypothetical protein LBD77_04705 [Bifidobacteriaceae bacterium]|jgi:hypothetical protein|nr:hypothetical protein [Bifidobacteriaceae bacterium]